VQVYQSSTKCITERCQNALKNSVQAIDFEKYDWARRNEALALIRMSLPAIGVWASLHVDWFDLLVANINILTHLAAAG
jgi:hypothetical protein